MREVSDEQATTYVFRRVQTRGRGPGVGPRLQPYRRLPFAGGGGFGLAPLGETAPAGARWLDPEEQGAHPRTAEDPGAGGSDQPAGAGESDPKKGYRSLDVGRTRSYALIDQLSKQESVEVVCSAFDVARSCYYVHRLRRRRVDARRVALRSQVNQLFSQSRGSAGSRSILGMLREEGVTIGRFRVRRLMRELGLVSKQPGSHAYKQATVERPDIPNRLNREFATGHPNQVWCGDITYVWAQGRWHYLAAVLDLHTGG